MRAYTDIFGRRFGFESNRVHVSGRPYNDRWIVYLGGLNLRVHRFWEGDDERAPHDHPWWFITFPFTGYWEMVEETWLSAAAIVKADCLSFSEPTKVMLQGINPINLAYPPNDARRYQIRHRKVNYVKPWRFHFRRATYRHIVLRANKPAGKPWWTFVIAGHRTRVWGFYPPGKSFVPWTEWV